MYRFVMHVIPCPTFITEPQYYDCLQNGIYIYCIKVSLFGRYKTQGWVKSLLQKICGFWHENGSKPHISA